MSERERQEEMDNLKGSNRSWMSLKGKQEELEVPEGSNRKSWKFSKGSNRKRKGRTRKIRTEPEACGELL
jgi:hypothetical protein